MTIRDLGYKPYEGARLPPSNTTWVIFRETLARANASWLVRLALLAAFGPPVVCSLGLGVVRYFAEAQGQLQETADFGARAMRWFFLGQMWGVASLVTLAAAAGLVAEDITFKAFPFLLTKSAGPKHYALGRVSAVALLLFAVFFFGSTLVAAAAAATAHPDHRLENAGLIIPALVHSTLIAGFLATSSVAVSSLGMSRALTRSAWALVFFAPHVVASLVTTASHQRFPWLYLTSLTGLLTTIGDALFKVEPTGELRWYHAAIVLLVVWAAAAAWILRRVGRQEVIT